jgi:hypothetical protein
MDILTVWIYMNGCKEGDIVWLSSKEYSPARIGRDTGYTGAAISKKMRKALGSEI